MTGHRLLFLLLVLLAADFAVPYELTARGVIELDDEQEAVRGRAADAPVPTLVRPLATAAAVRPRPSRRTTAPRRRRARLRRRISRPSSSPPSPGEAQ